MSMPLWLWWRRACVVTPCGCASWPRGMELQFWLATLTVCFGAWSPSPGGPGGGPWAASKPAFFCSAIFWMARKRFFRIWILFAMYPTVAYSVEERRFLERSCNFKMMDTDLVCLTSFNIRNRTGSNDCALGNPATEGLHVDYGSRNLRTVTFYYWQSLKVIGLRSHSSCTHCVVM